MNDEGTLVTQGRDSSGYDSDCDSNYSHLWYCGRHLRATVPGSDGLCGPCNGPQCASCERLQQALGSIDREKLMLMSSGVEIKSARTQSEDFAEGAGLPLEQARALIAERSEEHTLNSSHL